MNNNLSIQTKKKKQEIWEVVFFCVCQSLRHQIGILVAVERCGENDLHLDFNGICFGMKREKEKNDFHVIFQRNSISVRTYTRYANSGSHRILFFLFQHLASFSRNGFSLWSMCHHFRTLLLLCFQFIFFLLFLFFCLFICFCLFTDLDINSNSIH